jgi:hypothetical protein
MPAVPAVPVITAFSWPNAFWSLGLFTILGVVIWYKLHLLRIEIHSLAEKLPNLGSEFIRSEISEVRRDLERTMARVRLCERRQGVNGEDP